MTQPIEPAPLQEEEVVVESAPVGEAAPFEESVSEEPVAEMVEEAVSEPAADESTPTLCAGCGQAFTGDEKFCPGCGQPRLKAVPEEPVEETVTGPRLVLMKETEEITSFSIADDVPLTIGRLDTNTVSFPDDGYSSSKHAKVEKVDEDYFVEDLGSTNGTLIKVKRYKLSPGDVIYIGQNVLKFEV